MKDHDNNAVGRRTLLTNMSIAAAASLTASAGPVAAQEHAGFQPARHSKDAWLNEMAGDHRVFVDSSTIEGGGNALRSASNILKAHTEAYEGKAADYALVVCFRHRSTSYGFNDALWAKYGTLLSRNPDSKVTSNPMNTPSSDNGNNTIASLAKDGVRFAICNRATRAISNNIAESTGASADDVYAELVAGAIPNSHFVAAGVLAATRAQEYNYSLLYAE